MRPALPAQSPPAGLRGRAGVGKLPGEERSSYHTLAGFVMSYMGRVPAADDRFEWQGLRFEVVDMDGKRTDKVLVAPAVKRSTATDEHG